VISVFLLVRDEDETGVSGEGVVAAGMEFPDGHVVMRWLVGDHRSSVCWESMHAVEKIHGHNGKTRVVRVGKLNPMAPDPQLNVRDAYDAHIKKFVNISMVPRKKVAEFSGLGDIISKPPVVPQDKWTKLLDDTMSAYSRAIEKEYLRSTENYVFGTRALTKTPLKLRGSFTQC